MAIYYMNGKTFQDIFLKENPNKILRTQFVIVSSRIRRSRDSDRRNILSFTKQLMPSDMLLSDYRIDIDQDFFKDQYCKQLNENKSLLAVVVKGVIEENYTVVFLCSRNEWKLKYLKYLANYIWNEFGFPMYDYKKYKEGKEKAIQYNRDYAISVCNKVIAKSTKKKRKKLLSTRKGREELVANMSKDEMRMELKKMELYTQGMNKHEMKEMLELFFVD